MRWINPGTRIVVQFGAHLLAQGHDLPYASVDDLPPSVRAHLPPHGQDIYLAAFNNAWMEYQVRSPEQRERTAHRVAWAAVKRKYRKSGDRWSLRQTI